MFTWNRVMSIEWRFSGIEQRISSIESKGLRFKYNIIVYWKRDKSWCNQFNFEAQSREVGLNEEATELCQWLPVKRSLGIKFLTSFTGNMKGCCLGRKLKRVLARGGKRLLRTCLLFCITARSSQHQVQPLISPCSGANRPTQIPIRRPSAS